jgi:hypothetical protein
MTISHARKLQSTHRCPVCGDQRIAMELDLANGQATVSFACRASFTIANEKITVAAPCYAGTQLAAYFLNVETKGTNA